MDMSLAEQLVWAAVFSSEMGKDRTKAQRDLLAVGCAQIATKTVLDMRAGFKLAAADDAIRVAMGHSFSHLMQMTFRAED